LKVDFICKSRFFRPFGTMRKERGSPIDVGVPAKTTVP
jgi:hypothetical protein